MLHKVIRITALLLLSSIAGVCLFASVENSRHFPLATLDAFALNHLPNATAFAGNSDHQEAIRSSSTLVLLCSFVLALMLAISTRNGMTLDAALRKGGRQVSSWPILLVVGVLAVFPFVPLLNPESMASVRLVAEGIRESRFLLLLYSFVTLGGYLVVWYLIFQLAVSMFRRS